MKYMTIIVAAMVMSGGGLFAQDDSEGKVPAKKKQDEKAAPEAPKKEKKKGADPELVGLLRKGVNRVLEKGGYRLGGTVTNESMMGNLGVMIGGLGGLTGEVEGEFSVTAMEGMSHLVMEKKEWCLDIFSLNDQSVCRQTWKGRQINVDSFKKEVSKLIDWKAVVEAIAGSDKLRKAASRTVNGKECIVVEGSLPVDFLEDSADEENELIPGMKLQLKQIRKIGVEFCVSQEDSLLERVRFKLKKGASDLIKNQMGGLDEEDQEKMPDGFGMDEIMGEETIYTFVLEESGLEKGPEIPDDVLRFLQF